MARSKQQELAYSKIISLVMANYKSRKLILKIDLYLGSDSSWTSWGSVAHSLTLVNDCPLALEEVTSAVRKFKALPKSNISDRNV